MTGFLYAYRYGDGDHVKIGKTNDLEKRRNALQVAHHHPLVLADVIEHDDYEEGEKYIHQLLAHRRVQGERAGSREHFLADATELAEAFRDTRRYLDVELPRQREVPRYEALEAGEDILPATEDMLGVKHRSAEVRATRSRLQQEKDRLDNDARRAYQEVYQRQRAERERLDRLIHEVAVQEAELETMIKLAIGPAGGIDGVATWKSVRDRNRKFDPDWVKADDPELYDAYRTAFDRPRFKVEQPATYEAHMRITTHREFKWVDEVEPGSEERLSGGAQTQRASARTRLLGTTLHARRRQR